jgi:hypothetical protein
MIQEAAALSFTIDSSQAAKAGEALDQLTKQAGLSATSTKELAAQARDSQLALQQFAQQATLVEAGLRQAGGGIDYLVQRVQVLTREMGLFQATSRDMQVALNQLAAAGQLFGTTAGGIEAFARVSRTVGQNSIEMTQSLQRITQALDGVTLSGQRARSVLENYGVQVEGRPTEDAADILKEYVAARRRFQPDSRRNEDDWAVLGPVSIETLAAMNQPAFRSIEQERRSMEDSVATRRVLAQQEATASREARTGVRAQQYDDLAQEFYRGGMERFLPGYRPTREELERRAEAPNAQPRSQAYTFEQRADGTVGTRRDSRASRYLDAEGRPLTGPEYEAAVRAGQEVQRNPEFDMMNRVMQPFREMGAAFRWLADPRFAENQREIRSRFNEAAQRAGEGTAEDVWAFASGEMWSRSFGDMGRNLRGNYVPAPGAPARETSYRTGDLLQQTRIMESQIGQSPMELANRSFLLQAARSFGNINLEGAETLSAEQLLARFPDEAGPGAVGGLSPREVVRRNRAARDNAAVADNDRARDDRDLMRRAQMGQITPADLPRRTVTIGATDTQEEISLESLGFTETSSAQARQRLQQLAQAVLRVRATIETEGKQVEELLKTLAEVDRQREAEIGLQVEGTTRRMDFRERMRSTLTDASPGRQFENLYQSTRATVLEETGSPILANTRALEALTEAVIQMERLYNRMIEETRQDTRQSAGWTNFLLGGPRPAFEGTDDPNDVLARYGGGAGGRGGPPLTDGGTAAAPTGARRQAGQEIAAELQGYGVPRTMAVAMVAQVDVESSFNPRAVGDNGASYGLLQWQGERRRRFEQVVGGPIERSTRSQQVQFLAYEAGYPDAIPGAPPSTEARNTESARRETVPDRAAAALSRDFVRPFKVYEEQVTRGRRANAWNTVIPDEGADPARVGPVNLVVRLPGEVEPRERLGREAGVALPLPPPPRPPAAGPGQQLRERWEESNFGPMADRQEAQDPATVPPSRRPMSFGEFLSLGIRTSPRPAAAAPPTPLSSLLPGFIGSAAAATLDGGEPIVIARGPAPRPAPPVPTFPRLEPAPRPADTLIAPPPPPAPPRPAPPVAAQPSGGALLDRLGLDMGVPVLATPAGPPPTLPLTLPGLPPQPRRSVAADPGVRPNSPLLADLRGVAPAAPPPPPALTPSMDPPARRDTGVPPVAWPSLTSPAALPVPPPPAPAPRAPDPLFDSRSWSPPAPVPATPIVTPEAVALPQRGGWTSMTRPAPIPNNTPFDQGLDRQAAQLGAARALDAAQQAEAQAQERTRRFEQSIQLDLPETPLRIGRFEPPGRYRATRPNAVGVPEIEIVQPRQGRPLGPQSGDVTELPPERAVGRGGGGAPARPSYDFAAVEEFVRSGRPVSRDRLADYELQRRVGGQVQAVAGLTGEQREGLFAERLQQEAARSLEAFVQQLVRGNAAQEDAIKVIGARSEAEREAMTATNQARQQAETLRANARALPEGSAARGALEAAAGDLEPRARRQVFNRQIARADARIGEQEEDLQDARALGDAWFMTNTERARLAGRLGARRQAERTIIAGEDDGARGQRILRAEEVAGARSAMDELERQNRLVRDSFLDINSAAGAALSQIIVRGGNAKQVMAAVLADFASMGIRRATASLGEEAFSAIGKLITGRSADGPARGGFDGSVASAAAVAGGATESAASGATSLIGTALSSIGSLFGFAQGGVIRPMAQGDILFAPTYKAMANGDTALMAEAGPEAVLPLRRDANGNLGVVAAGGGGGGNVINITVQGGSRGPAQDREQAAAIADAVTRALDERQRQTMFEEMRVGGMFNPLHGG